VNLIERGAKLRWRLPLLLAVVCFGIGAFDALSKGKLWLGVVNLAAVAVNLAAWLLADRVPRWFGGVVLLINVPAALVQSASYFQEGKTGLPWVWLGVAIAYALVGGYKTRKALTG